MEFSEDFASIQGLLNSVYKSIGDFSTVHHVGGNEHKISKIVEDIQHFLTSNKYLRDGSVNQKHEMKIRKIILLLILNTDLTNKSLITNNKVAHLIGIMPQFSKCLLTNVVFRLGVFQYYCEAICSFPIQISLELLENCSKCIKKADPYSILEQTSTVASSIYYKIYHIRYEKNTKLDIHISKMLERFKDILKNYITPVSEQIMNWKTDKMYQYMGRAILEMLNLLKNCLNVYNMTEFVVPYYQFYQFNQETKTTHSVIDSPNTLSKSNETLTEFNKVLMSICESNVVAVTIDVFCSWAACTINDINLQEAVAYVAFDVLELIIKLEDVGDLPKMLSAIARKPLTTEDKINNADKLTILENVVVKNEEQKLWYKAFIRSGIFDTEEIYNIFKTLIQISDVEDYIYLLSLNTEVKNEFDLKEYLIQKLLEINPEDSIKIISEYFIKNGINEIYETENFNTKVRELLNKLKCDENESNNIPYKDISILVLQNPIKFMNNLLEESDKNLDHLTNILQILKYIRCICNIKCNDKEHTVLHEMVLNKLKHSNFEPNTETCIIHLINDLIQNQLLSNIIFDQLQEIMEDSIQNSNFKRASFICQLCKSLPISSMPSDNFVPVILKLSLLISELRWTFFSYSEEKVTLTSEIISLIYLYKNNRHNEIIIDGMKHEISIVYSAKREIFFTNSEPPFLIHNIYYENMKNAQEILKNKIDCFHIFCNKSENFLTYVSEGYDINSNHHEQVTRLINLLPRCVPLEWQLVSKYLVAHKNPIIVIQLLIDVMLILSEMSKKSSNNQESLSYCFQQFCVVVKDIKSTNENDIDLEKSFIKNICRLIKHLPDSLHNTVEISLVNLFNFEVLKYLKNDEDFVYSLVSISHLNICKIICSKMN